MKIKNRIQLELAFALTLGLLTLSACSQAVEFSPGPDLSQYSEVSPPVSPPPLPPPVKPPLVPPVKVPTTSSLCTTSESMTMMIQNAQFCVLNLKSLPTPILLGRDSAGLWSEEWENYMAVADPTFGALYIEDFSNQAVSPEAQVSIGTDPDAGFVDYVGASTSLEGLTLFCYHMCDASGHIPPASYVFYCPLGGCP